MKLRRLKGEWAQAFCAKTSGIVWVGKHYLWLVNGCLGYHRPLITNACPPKWSQRSLLPQLVPSLPGVAEGRNAQIPLWEICAKAKQMMGYWGSGRKTKPAWCPKRNAKLTVGISLQEVAARKFTFRWVISMLLGSLRNEDDYESNENVAKRMRFASFQTSSRLFGSAQLVNCTRFFRKLNS